MLIRKPGNKKITKIEESLEYRPLEALLSDKKDKHLDYGVELFVARIVNKEVQEIYARGNPEPVSVHTDTYNNSWKIVSDKEIQEYLDGGLLMNFRLDNFANKKFRGQLALCKESEIVVAEEKNRVTFYDDKREFAPFVEASTEKNIESGEPLRLVEQYDYDMSMFLRTSNETYLARPIYTEVRNEDWNLEQLKDILKEQSNWKFIIPGETYSQRRELLEENNDDALKRAISYVPHYNQNEEGTLKEMFGVFIPNTDHIKVLLTQERVNYKWAKDFYSGNLDKNELESVFFYEKNNIVAYCLNGHEASLEYQKHIAENQSTNYKKITP